MPPLSASCERETAQETRWLLKACRSKGACIAGRWPVGHVLCTCRAVTPRVLTPVACSSHSQVRDSDAYDPENKGDFEEIDVEFLNGCPGYPNSVWLNSYHRYSCPGLRRPCFVLEAGQGPPTVGPACVVSEFTICWVMQLQSLPKCSGTFTPSVQGRLEACMGAHHH